jgi:hypothetical protein
VSFDNGPRYRQAHAHAFTLCRKKRLKHLFKVVNGNAGAGMRSFLEFAAPRLRKSLESDEAKLSAKLPRPLARSPKGVTKDKPKKEKAVA